MAKRLPEWLVDAGLLILRAGIGGMMLLGHGWPKLVGFSEGASGFPDPLGVGSTASLVLTILAEVGASALLVIGLGTRAAAAALLFTMVVAAFVVHSGDPWSQKELAFVYMVPPLALILTGAGRFSVDGLIVRRRERS